MAVLSSAKHPQFKKWKALAESAKDRRVQGLILAEGPHLVEEALASGAVAEVAILTEAFQKDPARQGLLRALRDKGLPCRVISEKLAARLALTESPQGIFLVCRPAMGNSLEEWLAKPNDLVVLAHGLQDPGNLGTLLRCAWAAGANGVVFSGDSADPWSAKALRSGAGSQFHLPCFEARSAEDFMAVMKKNGVLTVAATPHQGTNYLDMDFRKPICLILGPEGPGLPENVVQAADLRAKIEHPGGAESLNVAVSGAVFLFEILRQRRKTL